MFVPVLEQSTRPCAIAGLDFVTGIRQAPRMAYRRPAPFVRKVFNPIALRFGIGGTIPLKVRRRRTGGVQTVPVIVLDHEGARFLVSARGETDWVRNLRAAGGAGELGDRPFESIEVPVEERPPILAAYQQLAGQAVKSHFKALPDPADHPVFRLATPGATP
jgi:hypothetical protein